MITNAKLTKYVSNFTTDPYTQRNLPFQAKEILIWSCKDYTQLTHKELEIFICLYANMSAIKKQQSN